VEMLRLRRVSKIIRLGVGQNGMNWMELGTRAFIGVLGKEHKGPC
jgi:hypothetical protein